MRIKESAIIRADAETVWPYIADPVLHADWNPKIVSIDRATSGIARVGERFHMLVWMHRGRERLIGVEITDVQALQRVTFLHTVPDKRTEQVIEERYDITPHGDGVKVVRAVDFSRAKIPWPLRLLMWFVFRFGWSADEPLLNRLKRQIEQPGKDGQAMGRQ